MIWLAYIETDGVRRAVLVSYKPESIVFMTVVWHTTVPITWHQLMAPPNACFSTVVALDRQEQESRGFCCLVVVPLARNPVVRYSTCHQMDRPGQPPLASSIHVWALRSLAPTSCSLPAFSVSIKSINITLAYIRHDMDKLLKSIKARSPPNS
ncbi:hypothetical protein T07_15002 [Trichinella nelsoni]|uniref:Uncharacterized protein n=1 Tax=Trichinella nelsoni TaxID=6336 RepID=A0A0V0S8E8_9BILA|nr:hypothetical protein T07_15002 [Trichinella nelsoni]